MINFYLHSFLISRALLWNEMAGADVAHLKNPLEIVPSSLMPSIERRVRMAIKEYGFLIDTDAVANTCIRLENLFNTNLPYTWAQLHELLRRLWDLVEEGLAAEHFCHYTRDMGEQLSLVDTDWRQTIKAFPSGEIEIRAAIDCYALGHYPACVFYMCRVGELGLRVIGRERGIRKLKNRRTPIEYGTWGQVIGAIEPAIEKIRQKPKGPQKEAALKFYETAIADLTALQNLRDPTMHFRDSYDKGNAETAIFRVKELMTTLASKLDENSIRPIPWSAWK